MFAIMFETKIAGVEKQIQNLLTQNGFSKVALPGSNIYRHISDNMMSVHIIINQMLEEYKGRVDYLFVCKIDDLSDFSDLC